MLTAVKIFPFGPIKVIPQEKKKVIRQFFQSFLKCSLPMSVSKNITKKIGYLACLREMTGQTYPTSASTTSTSAFSRTSFHGTFFDSWKQL